MICLQEVKRYCQEYYLIENYDQAIADKTQPWHCHHRFEIDYNMSRLELQAMGFYFNRPFDELIFLTPEEHGRMHMEGENNPNYGKEGYWKGKEVSWKGKRSGENNPNYKYHIPEEELYNLYVVQGLSTYKIAEKYGCNQVCIWNKLKKYNIKK